MEIIRETRPAGNRGAFYPATCEEIEHYIQIFSRNVGGIQGARFLDIKPKAIISPHAGYIYSGFTANAAHGTLANSKPKTIVVIGPSHHVFIDGVSAAFTKYYETPCGLLETDQKMLETLHEEFGFVFDETAHFKEHSTETQMPFIAHYNPQASIVELIYGRTDYRHLAQIIDKVLSMPDTAVVISSDLSHFYPLHQAEKLDALCVDGVAKKDLALLEKGCEACGITGIQAMISAALKNNWNTGILDYRTSADASGDTTRVVGYMSAVIW